MIFSPIAVRELRVAARRPVTYSLRSWMALAAAVLAVLFAVAEHGPASGNGRMIFSVLSLIGLAYAMVSGIRCTADCISEEKRSGTLGLLFLTDLRGSDVVVGKVVVSSLEAAYGLVAMLPVLALPLLMGAVSAGEYWRMVFLLLVVLFYSVMCGLVVSTFGRQERRVYGVTLFVMLFLAFGLPVLWKAASVLSGSPVFDGLLLASPAYAYTTVASNAGRFGASDYLLSLCAMLGVATGAGVVSSYFVAKSIQQEDAVREVVRDVPHRRRAKEQWRRFVSKDKRLLEHNPFLWLLSRERWSHRVGAGFAVMVVLFAFVVPSLLQQRARWEGTVVYSAFGLHILYKVLVASNACRQLNEEKRSGSLELLLSTPLPVEQILRGQWLGTRSVILKPALSLALLSLVIALSAGNLMGELGWNFLGGVIMLALDARALAWLGIYHALRQPRYVRAVVYTWATVILPPWGICLLFVLSGPNSSSAKVFFFWWSVAAGLYDLGLAKAAKDSLVGEFRYWAANDFERRQREWEPAVRPLARLCRY